MTYPFPPDLQQMVSARLAQGAYQSEDDVLRSALEALEEREEDLLAIQAAVDEWRAGDEGLALAEAFSSLRTSRSSETSQ